MDRASNSRRDFLRTALAGAALVAFPYRQGIGAPRVLRPKVARASLAGADHPQTEVWGYEGAVPGPELRFRQGERRMVEIENVLP